MDVLAILLIAVGLAMDAFAVSIGKGITIVTGRRRSALLIASFFGGFQMAMPALGWLAGQTLKEIIMGIDHWIAFGLLVIIGSRMIYDLAQRENKEMEDNLRLHTLLTLSVATSIDALMVGLSFAFLQTSLIEPILLIGLITFSLSLIGFSFGCGLERVFGQKIKILGGSILIAIGIRILLEHLL